jgi:4-hydroxybenzoate polyprenyltransferase
MFIGRIILKDFRDRKGDAKYHKPTFLLRFGKNATCLFSLACILAGGAVLMALTSNIVWLTILVAAYLATIVTMLRRLWCAEPGTDEQLAIGVAAKMGNGLLLSLISYFLLAGSVKEGASQLVGTLAISVLFFGNFFVFLLQPKRAVIGYRG